MDAKLNDFSNEYFEIINQVTTYYLEKYESIEETRKYFVEQLHVISDKTTIELIRNCIHFLDRSER
ncbi:hypothetical protein [Listeria fleischmannii]|uniref:Uncharacterized protein n=1 Tax=Listeria fleischmannii FSL S10-1203 TaxID=1265822 RepID=W7DIR6_9LIST|nr:hypothetical protein [Listeria fleischmannii]EUJ64824.1 hypothetical protein MCOL2_01455 [Listeria fleischmannii FSL S10-1203]